MTVLVVGASGATGKLLVSRLLDLDVHVRAVVRNKSSLPESISRHERLTVIEGSILEFSDSDIAHHVEGCDAIASCLGHNMNFRGVFGKPRRLVRDTVRRLWKSVCTETRDVPVKFVLMNTAGNRNMDLSERVSFGEHLILGIIRTLLPPHSDNETAADVLRREVGQQHPCMEWVVVRPDTLIDADEPGGYTAHPSPVRSAIFNPGTTSRINVAYFMAELIRDQEVWHRWKGQMPVIYNDQSKK